MAKVKLIVTDLDGTFLSHVAQDDSFEDNVAAMRKAQEAGIPVFPCTGRSWQQAKAQVEGLGFSNLIVVNNGASVVEMDTEKLRYRNRLAGEYVSQLANLGEKYNLITQIATTEFMGFLDPADQNKREWFVERYGPQMTDENDIVIFKTVAEMAEAGKDSTELFRYITEPADIPEEMMQELRGMKGVEVAWSYKLHLDVMAKGANKGSVLPLLADICDTTVGNIMALGDQDNDVPMIEMAGTGVAMGDASKRAKEVADYITDDAKNSGFAKAVYQYALEEEYPGEKF